MKVLITAAVLATTLWLASPQQASAGWYGPQIYVDAYIPYVPVVPVYTPYVGVSFYGGYWGGPRRYYGRPYGYGGYYGGGYYGHGGHGHGGHRSGGGYGGHRGGGGRGGRGGHR